MQDLERQVSQERVRVSAKVRTWIHGFVADGLKDPVQTATRLGLSRPDRTRDWPSKYFNLIETENLRARMGRQMELDEALIEVADLARTCPDLKVRGSMLRTVLEVHGALSAKPLPPGDRKDVVRQLEEIIGRIKKKAAGGNPGAKEPRVALTVGLEIGETEPETTSGAPNTPSDSPSDSDPQNSISPAASAVVDVVPSK